MKSFKGSLITFSGLDGAGKSTQIELLMDYLARRGEKPIYLWTRGGYTGFFQGLKTLSRRLLGQKLPPSGNNPQRQLVFSKRWVRRLWLYLAMLDLLWVYGVQFRWHRQRRRPVVCDRYLWDTSIDFRLNFPQERIDDHWLWRLLTKVSPKPDASFLMLVTVAESVRRSEIKGAPFPDSPEVLGQRLAHYLDFIQRVPFHVLDGAQPASKLHRKVLTALNLV